MYRSNSFSSYFPSNIQTIKTSSLGFYQVDLPKKENKKKTQEQRIGTIRSFNVPNDSPLKKWFTIRLKRREILTDGKKGASVPDAIKNKRYLAEISDKLKVMLPWKDPVDHLTSTLQQSRRVLEVRSRRGDTIGVASATWREVFVLRQKRKSPVGAWNSMRPRDLS